MKPTKNSYSLCVSLLHLICLSKLAEAEKKSTLVFYDCMNVYVFVFEPKNQVFDLDSNCNFMLEIKT